MSFKFDCMTGSMVSTNINMPLDPHDPRPAGVS